MAAPHIHIHLHMHLPDEDVFTNQNHDAEPNVVQPVPEQHSDCKHTTLQEEPTCRCQHSPLQQQQMCDCQVPKTYPHSNPQNQNRQYGFTNQIHTEPEEDDVDESILDELQFELYWEQLAHEEYDSSAESNGD